MVLKMYVMTLSLVTEMVMAITAVEAVFFRPPGAVVCGTSNPRRRTTTHCVC